MRLFRLATETAAIFVGFCFMLLLLLALPLWCVIAWTPLVIGYGIFFGIKWVKKWGRT